MPIIAIGAAALAVGTAASGIAAAGLTLVTALETVAAIGATLGAIGAVTGDKTLGTIGMIMGAVGGIGSIAASAGLFGEGAASAQLFGSSAEIAAPNIAGEVSIDTAGLSNLPDLSAVTASPATSATPDVFAALDPAAAAGNAAAPAVSQAAELTGLEGPASAGGAEAAATAPTAAASATAPVANQVPTGLINQAGPAASPVESVTVTAPSMPAPAAPASPSVPVADAPANTSVLGSLGKFAKDNPLVAYGVVQAAGSFISGATNPLTPAQVSALQAQAAANQANADMTAQQAANMKQPIPVATRVKGGSGLINYAPQNAVTGRAA